MAPKYRKNPSHQDSLPDRKTQAKHNTSTKTILNEPCMRPYSTETREGYSFVKLFSSQSPGFRARIHQNEDQMLMQSPTMALRRESGG